MATSTAAQGKVYYIHSNVCMCLPDVSCSWPMLLGGDGDKEHVQKLWTSMHNSAYDCDKKNLIAPLNSLGTLEIYYVIKTAN